MGNCCKWLFKNQTKLEVSKHPELSFENSFHQVPIQSKQTIDEPTQQTKQIIQSTKMTKHNKLPQIKPQNSKKSLQKQQPKPIFTPQKQPLKTQQTQSIHKTPNNLTQQSRVQIMIDNKLAAQKYPQQTIQNSKTPLKNNNLPLSQINEDEDGLWDEEDVKVVIQKQMKMQLNQTDSRMIHISNDRNDKQSELNSVDKKSHQVKKSERVVNRPSIQMTSSQMVNSGAPIHHHFQSKVQPRLSMTDSQVINIEDTKNNKQSPMIQTTKTSQNNFDPQNAQNKRKTKIQMTSSEMLNSASPINQLQSKIQPKLTITQSQVLTSQIQYKGLPKVPQELKKNSGMAKIRAMQSYATVIKQVQSEKMEQNQNQNQFDVDILKNIPDSVHQSKVKDGFDMFQQIPQHSVIKKRSQKLSNMTVSLKLSEF